MPLTYRNCSDIRGAASTDGGEVGAPKQEIEITPEMIVAGGIELAWHGSWKRTDEEVVTRIYMAMVLARLPKLDQEPHRGAERIHA